MNATCKLGLHVWMSWNDTNNQIEKRSVMSSTIVAHGREQERRCKRCNKLQRRVAWVRLP